MHSESLKSVPFAAMTQVFGEAGRASISAALFAALTPDQGPVR